jgi:hypothetical protein
MLQRKASLGRDLGEVPPIVYDVLRSPGQTLDPATRALMEPHFGQDFSRVRIHNDANSADSALAVGAAAFTVQNHVVFGSGYYQPATVEGMSLIAHELTHVVQQGRYPMMHEPLTIGTEESASEREAAHHEQTFLRHTGARVKVATGSRTLERSVIPAPFWAAKSKGCDCICEDIYGGRNRFGRKSSPFACEQYCKIRSKEAHAGSQCPNANAEERVREAVPGWILALLSAAAIACFATGACELATLILGLPVAVAAALILALRKAGLLSGNETTSAEATVGKSTEVAV